MKVKLDENLGQLHAQLVRDAGHVAQRVTDRVAKAEKQLRVLSGAFWRSMASSPWQAVWR
jgi:hypothetical protein